MARCACRRACVHCRVIVKSLCAPIHEVLYLSIAAVFADFTLILFFPSNFSRSLCFITASWPPVLALLLCPWLMYRYCVHFTGHYTSDVLFVKENSPPVWASVNDAHVEHIGDDEAMTRRLRVPSLRKRSAMCSCIAWLALVALCCHAIWY